MFWVLFAGWWTHYLHSVSAADSIPLSLILFELSSYDVNTVQLHVHAADVLVRRGIHREGFQITTDRHVCLRVTISTVAGAYLNGMCAMTIIYGNNLRPCLENVRMTTAFSASEGAFRVEARGQAPGHGGVKV